MSNTRSRVLSPMDAARIIYGTNPPSAEQVDKVRYKLARGVLKKSAEGGWTTTPEAVADYLSQCSSKGMLSTRAPTHRRMFKVYQEILREYCLALVARRSISRRSRTFQVAVVLGQVACLLILSLACLPALRHGTRQIPEEHAIVTRWISDHEGQFQVVKWFPVSSGDEVNVRHVRVQYRYAVNPNKQVTTDRLFVIRGTQVTSVQPWGE